MCTNKVDFWHPILQQCMNNYLQNVNMTGISKTLNMKENKCGVLFAYHLENIVGVLWLGCARLAEILQHFVARQVFGRICLIVFLAFTLKLPIQTLLSVAPTCSFFWRTTQFQQNKHIPATSLLHSLFGRLMRTKILQHKSHNSHLCTTWEQKIKFTLV